MANVVCVETMILPDHRATHGSPIRFTIIEQSILSTFMVIAIKRVYDPASKADGARILVDRLWPRGLTKEKAAVDEWLRDIAPSTELRHWYHSQPGNWEAFRKKYLQELSQPACEESLRKLYALAQAKKRLTLLFASKEETHNNATVLKELLEGRRKPPTGTGPGAGYAVRGRQAAVRRR